VTVYSPANFTGGGKFRARIIAIPTLISPIYSLTNALETR
jgi:hypothetical protein